MRAVLIGAGELSDITARQLLDNNFEVVIIEKDKDRITELSETLDAGFIHGDGSKPQILREANPSSTDFLFCLAGNDQYNIIASLVGRSLGYKRVITRIEDPSYEHICIELGLKDVIVPDYTIARYLVSMCKGEKALEASALIKEDARIFSFVAREEDETSIDELSLPAESRLMFLYRKEKFILPDKDTTLKKGDEVVIIAASKALPELTERFNPGLEDEQESSGNK